jgi:hypothetical protein
MQDTAIYRTLPQTTLRIVKPMKDHPIKTSNGFIMIESIVTPTPARIRCSQPAFTRRITPIAALGYTVGCTRDLRGNRPLEAVLPNLEL